MTEQEKREKVIRGLECCIVGKCEKCEYEKDGCLKNSMTFMNGLKRDALALLKAQEPVEPIPGLWDRDIQLYKCGACGGEIGAGGIAKYCFHCGRAVKWDE